MTREKTTRKASTKAAPSKKKASVVDKSVTLANQYRPKTFSEVFGQDAAVAALEGCFKKDRIPSAILISGHYGCGKTTLANIFARQVNCEKGTLCGKCFSCQFGKHPDIVFYDAAINGKIDEVRSLVAGSRNAPATRKRVIICDEVHMWRDASEKAMLVALENPAPNTVWILCTTNPEKLAKPLVSRCMHISLRPIPQDILETRLVEIAEKEGLKVDKVHRKTITEVAAMSDGSMREAVSKLEMMLLVLASGKKFSVESLVEAVGGADADIDNKACDLIEGVLTLDSTKAITAVRAANNARMLLNRSRWLIDFLIGQKTKTAKFTPYTGRLFLQRKVKTSLTLLVELQSVLLETEMRMNSVSIDENVLLYSAVGKLISEYS